MKKLGQEKKKNLERLLVEIKISVDSVPQTRGRKY